MGGVEDYEADHQLSDQQTKEHHPNYLLSPRVDNGPMYARQPQSSHKASQMSEIVDRGRVGWCEDEDEDYDDEAGTPNLALHYGSYQIQPIPIHEDIA